MYPTQLHSYLLWRSSVKPEPQSLASWRYTALVCLLPTTMVGIFVFGWWAALVIFTSMLSAFVTDWVTHRYIYKDSPGTRDGIWLLTGLLLALLLPPNVPLWVPLLGAAIAIFVGKYYLSVDSMPLLTPTRVGWVALHFIGFGMGVVTDSNPMQARLDGKTRWPVLIRDVEPSSGELSSPSTAVPKLLRDFFGGDVRNSITRKEYREASFGGAEVSQTKVEAVHGPRPIDNVKRYPDRPASRSAQAAPAPGDKIETWDMILGALPGTIGGSGALALFFGIALLLFTGAASVVIPLFSMATMFALLHFVAWVSPGRVLSDNISIHLLTGSTLLTIFFLAADPLTAPRAFMGRVYAGVTLGVLETLLRLFSPLAEGMVISVLAIQLLSYVYDEILAPPQVESIQPTAPSITSTSLGRL